MKNAHEVIDSFTYTQDARIVFDEKNPRQSETDAQSVMNADGSLEAVPAKSLSEEGAEYLAATNQLDKLNDYMASEEVTNMSRADLEGTFPTEPPEERQASDEFAAQYDQFDYLTDEELGNVESSKIYQEDAPVQGQDNGLVLSDMRGLNYYDPKWEEFLDQIVYDEDTLKITAGGNYVTAATEYLGVPATSSHDGPVGLTGVYATGQTVDACSWCSTTLLAATYNVDLAYDMGAAVGEEALAIDSAGWFAPGINIHRSPFSGHNFEYYSEDPLVSGKMAAKCVSGAGDKGVSAFIKHFALNDEEVNRYVQNSVWATEQTIREIYLRGFEICVKEAVCTVNYVIDDKGTIGSTTQRAAKALMTTHYRIGTDHSTECYPTLTNILRDEWGFTGMTITDMMDGVNYDRRLRAGLDVSMDARSVSSFEDTESPTAQWAIRKSIHNICYTIANSSAMNHMAPGATVSQATPGWKTGLTAVNIVIVILLILSVFWIVWRTKDAKRNPERYAGTPEGNAMKVQYRASAAYKREKRIKRILLLVILAIILILGIRPLLNWLVMISI